MTDIKVSYETIFDILRREKQREELQELPATFIADVQAYLHDKEELLKHPFSKEHDHVRTQIANTKKILIEIIERRENKIIRLAQDKARGSTIPVSALLPQEQAFFQDAASIIAAQRKNLSEGLFSAVPVRLPAVTVRDAGAAGEGRDAGKESGKAEEVKDAMKRPTKPIRILQPLPKFVGKNLEVYGPFQAEETVELPGEIADILIRKGRAKEA